MCRCVWLDRLWLRIEMLLRLRHGNCEGPVIGHWLRLRLRLRHWLRLRLRHGLLLRLRQRLQHWLRPHCNVTTATARAP